MNTHNDKVKSERWTLIRISQREITDKTFIHNWPLAVDAFAQAVKREQNGCTWELIDPKGQIAIKAEF